MKVGEIKFEAEPTGLPNRMDVGIRDSEEQRTRFLVCATGNSEAIDI